MYGLVERVPCMMANWNKVISYCEIQKAPQRCGAFIYKIK